LFILIKMSTKNPDCQRRYKAYKEFCPKNVFTYSEMAKIRDNVSTNEVIELLKKISDKKEVLQRCYFLRNEYSKRCYSEIDEGHQKHFKVLDDHIKKFEDQIRRLNEILRNRMTTSTTPKTSAWGRGGSKRPRKKTKKTSKKSLRRRK
jgi:hypothetical protein